MVEWTLIFDVSFWGWIALVSAIVSLLATFWTFQLGRKISSSEVRKDGDAPKLHKLERHLFKQFWSWLSIVGGIVTVVTVAAWVLISAGFSGEARDVANKEAKRAFADYQQKLQQAENLQEKLATLETLSSEIIRTIQKTEGRVEQLSISAGSLADQAQESASLAAQRAREAERQLNEMRTRYEDADKVTTALKDLGAAIKTIAEDDVFQGFVVNEVMSRFEGLVIASSKKCDDLEGGWGPYEKATGRMIVGVGSATDREGQEKEFAFEAEDGEFEHTLTVAEMPPHTHFLAGSTKGGEKASGRTGSVRASNSNDVEVVSVSTGNGIPHNNMPPYIALYFCKKEAG